LAKLTSLASRAASPCLLGRREHPRERRWRGSLCPAGVGRLTAGWWLLFCDSSKPAT
jgi:hypothetical protein